MIAAVVRESKFEYRKELGIANLLRSQYISMLPHAPCFLAQSLRYYADWQELRN
jgi:hypothetical protein